MIYFFNDEMEGDEVEDVDGEEMPEDGEELA